MLSQMNSEYMLQLKESLPNQLKNIPKPYFITDLFPESPIAICRPLFPPFDHLAISHYGEIFCYRPLKVITINHEIRIIDPTMCLQPDLYETEPAGIRLVSQRWNIEKDYFIERLVLERFYHVGLDEKIYVDHLDGDPGNNHINNLVVHPL